MSTVPIIPMSGGVSTAPQLGGPLPFPLPDIPQLTLKQVLDQSAFINVLASAGPELSIAIPAPGAPGQILGARVRVPLHRFGIRAFPPSAEEGRRASDAVGKRTGELRFCWQLILEMYYSKLGLHPPFTVLDQSHPL